ncbi:TetR/AcrR family transcriptional regulator [Sphingomonas carotinifaciens]|nr:TetR/AcrR family transcriptional regulator [Sphingomonas carotinifaciens]MBB4087617.1 AcrR family transcriptional regulator [Sphingomonas carotinifaciens]MWC45702.1 TetR family transcriptional regulator [Sphingomonas carotinifaciens]
MRAQRDGIARAALGVLLEKGVANTSQRDICSAAGVSVGALYTHFATIEEVVVAACTLGNEELPPLKTCETWDEYVEFNVANVYDSRVADAARRIRLAFEFAAKIVTMDKAPAGVAAIHDIQNNYIRDQLQRSFDRGEISLPLGLATTTMIHVQALVGASTQLAMNPSLNRDQWITSLIRSLEITAGRVRIQ